MAFDQAGKFHLSPQRARQSDRQRGPMQPEREQDGEHDHPTIHHIEVHPHGDGTHHTVTHYHEGEPQREDHEHLEEVHDKLDNEIGDEGAMADDEPGTDEEDGY